MVQVSIDAPRTAPEVPLFQHRIMQTALRRLLYIWGVRHPASGYVQGVNDLVTPFFAVFLSEYLGGPLSEWDLESLKEEQLLAAEADAYWCLSKLVERCGTWTLFTC
jgi:TBC1 domain family member 2